MSNRRRPRPARRRSPAAAAWWAETGRRLGCTGCLEGPPCDCCGAPAVTVAAVVSDYRSGLDGLRGHHHHYCGPCRDHEQLDSGVPRYELG